MFRRWKAASAVLAATAFLAAGCTGTVNPSGSSPAGGSSASSGQPQRGGTLTMLGQSDIFNLDTVSAYYTVSSMLERMFTRQLFTYGVPNGSSAPPPVVPDIATASDDGIVAVDEALLELKKVDADLAKIVELRFFGGLEHDEIATVLGVSNPTVRRRFRIAKAWLFRRLSQGAP